MIGVWEERIEDEKIFNKIFQYLSNSDFTVREKSYNANSFPILEKWYPPFAESFNVMYGHGFASNR